MADDADQIFNRILVPLDGSRLAAQILPVVASLASQLNATVNLVYVLTPLTYAQKEIMQPGLPWWDEDIEIANAYLADMTEYLARVGLPVGKEVVLSEDIAGAILDYGVRMGADLIALATTGAGGISRLLFGGVADEITRRSRTSLLVFHPDEITGHPVSAAEHEAENHVSA